MDQFVATRRATLHVFAIALALTLFNCAKPLHVDEPFYLDHAAQIVKDPLRPYGFEVFWHRWPEPAISEVCPPVLPYYLAACLGLFGERPWLWKLALLPVALLFVGSLNALLTRFRAGMRLPLLWSTALSPALVPSFNLMPDLPALALGLTSLAAFARALDLRSYRAAALAGLMAGLAAQTKYTAATVPTALLAYGALFGGMQLGLVAVLTATAVFGGWELFVYLQEGWSHFLYVFGLRDTLRYPFRPDLLRPLAAHLGAVAPALTLLGWLALGASPALVAAGALALAGAYVLGAGVGRPDAFEAAGAVTLLSVALTAGRLLVAVYAGRTKSQDAGSQAGVEDEPSSDADRSFAGPVPPADRDIRLSWFLVLWLAIELTGYMRLSPFSATRRVLGVLMPATVLVGVLAGRLPARPGRRRAANVVATGGVILGISFGALDWWEAWTRKWLADRAGVLTAGDPGTVWFTGHWGFQYYAERAGLRALVPDHSQLRRGDWVIQAGWGLDRQAVDLGPARPEKVGTLLPPDRVPLNMLHFYAGDYPLTPQSGPRVSADVFRVGADCVPESPYDSELLARWAAGLNRPVPPAAESAVCRALDRLGDKGAAATAVLPALRKLETNPDSGIREAAARAVRRIDQPSGLD